MTQTKQRALKQIEAELDEANRAVVELTAESSETAGRLKFEAVAALDVALKGNKTPRLDGALLRAEALPHLIHAAQLRQATLFEEPRQRRLTQIEQEQRLLGEKVERAEAERRHALCTSDGDARLEAEAQIEVARMQLFALGDERRELEVDENRSLNRIRYLEKNGPDAPGGGVIARATMPRF